MGLKQALQLLEKLSVRLVAIAPSSDFAWAGVESLSGQCRFGSFVVLKFLALTCAKGRACLIIPMMIALIYTKFAPDLLRRA